jgi:hypothetical protein
LIDPLAGIPLQEPVIEKYRNWVGADYSSGLLGMETGSVNYKSLYGFGAYLARNYGGPELLAEMLKNDALGIDAINAALAKTPHGIDFNEALAGYAQALVFSGSHRPEGAPYFDRTVYDDINGVRYTLEGFDVWDLQLSVEDLMVYKLPMDYKGPLVRNVLAEKDTLYWENISAPYSVSLSSFDEWQNVQTDSLDIELSPPADPSVEMWILVR